MHVQIARLVDVMPQGQRPPRAPRPRETLDRLRIHLARAPRDVAEQRIVRRAQADQPVATVSRRSQHDLRVIGQPVRREREIRARRVDEISPHQQHARMPPQHLGAGRVKYIHPDCGFWMLKRSIADRKIEALAKGRDRFLGR